MAQGCEGWRRGAAATVLGWTMLASRPCFVESAGAYLLLGSRFVESSAALSYAPSREEVCIHGRGHVDDVRNGAGGFVLVVSHVVFTEDLRTDLARRQLHGEAPTALACPNTAILHLRTRQFAV